ncbi:hypothetical protein P5G65_18080 [Paenibacillus chondroitinus]|uniref:Uncharacterized protein n=1 Tax=Paenibacillus chondroitinus TaxID=59842 RepID=A0ABU6DG31_9BACL|nr:MULTISPECIES: hypothetical protein [Paenibacillus]MCY9662361.1 DUF3231 family protein [Paenibacillus anseongense]MEB4795812.1 hypothetical protein [Paenibacillus chondroitinus]
MRAGLLSESKNELMNSPVIQPLEKVDFVHSQKFLGSFFQKGRPLQGLEIAHIFGNLNNDITSKALIIGFAQVANAKAHRIVNRKIVSRWIALPDTKRSFGDFFCNLTIF